MKPMVRFLMMAFLAGIASFTGMDHPSLGNRYALLIGIGQYPSGSGAESLHARNDLLLLSETLRKQGFPASHIRMLADQQATRQAIAQVFDSLARALPTGSRVVVHFSGHGLQLPDDNHDETDGLDEAIFPVDGQLKRPTTMIRDDLLAQWLARLRKRIGPYGHLLFLFDSCHSGSILRQNQSDGRLSRGIASPAVALNKRVVAGTSGWFDEKTTAAVPSRLGQYVLLAATADGQPSFEYTDASGQAFGPLTLAVCQAWASNPAPPSYRFFFQTVRQRMSRLAPYQLPTAEGTIDAPFLGQ
ncbi:caspase family protein [Fibrella arboris]|uniref:caspase family protein n=1 Tax=Fibrella arboris TaxID=3242486 RepID=UPI00352003F1